ncbi:porin family protein [Cesiribacter sp. SM1]|uniref:porin family protein n=1 Tax=Cesiribacter sp. SM1 TaxID=2861196 RepID=UPI001CD2BE9A|nr:porin family protein [Cesiribacter sp. SM1]
MKKSLLMMAMLAFLAYQANAQNHNRFQLGLKAGANYANVYDTEGEAFKANAKPGLAAGVFTSIPVLNFISIQPEILFSQKGFKASGRLLGNSYSLERTSNSLDVPLLVAFKPFRAFTLLAGPQYSYLLSQKDVFENGATTIEQEQEFLNDDYRKYNLAFVGGADVAVKHLVIGARAGWDLIKNNGNGNAATPRYKNAWFQATVGYMF